MPDPDGLFSSPRERRLWIITALLVSGIYATLGVASVLAEWLYNQQLAAVAFVGCMLLVLATIVAFALQSRPRGVEIGAGLGIGVVYTLVLLRLTLPERSHLIEYGVVAAFVYEACTERARQGRTVPVPGLLAIIVTSAFGIGDELIQYFLPNRVFEYTDMLFNFLAATMFVTAIAILRKVSGIQ